MKNNKEALDELPLKWTKNGLETWEEFKDLKRIASCTKLSSTDHDLLRREIIARRDKMGLVRGVNIRRMVDGEYKYVNPK